MLPTSEADLPPPNRPAAEEVNVAGLALADEAIVVACAAADVAAPVPNKDDAGLDVAGADDLSPPKRPPAVEVVDGAANNAVVAAGLLPNKPPAAALVAGVEEDVAAELEAAVPNRLGPVPVEAGPAVVEEVEAGFTVNGLAVPVAAADVAVDLPVAALPKRPPVDVPGAGAALFPNKPPAVLPNCRLEKGPEAVGAAGLLVVEVAGWVAPPNIAPAEVPAAGLDGSAGGAPAGVVDGKSDEGFAGVAAAVVVL